VLFKVAFLQLSSCMSAEKAMTKGLDACRQAKTLGADLAVFPELWQVSYKYKKISPKQAMTVDDPLFTAYRHLAQELKMAIALTYLKKNTHFMSNQVTIIDMHGNVILEYAQVHLDDMGQDAAKMRAGDDFKVATLFFQTGSVNVGVMLGIDHAFPESARILALKKAEMIIAPCACLLHDDATLWDGRFNCFRVRAMENALGIAVVNYPKPRCDGHSCGFDEEGMVLFAPQSKEKVVVASFELDKIRQRQAIRQSLVYWQRKPQCYYDLANEA